jgi:Chitin binding Peritrophin-A domain
MKRVSAKMKYFALIFLLLTIEFVRSQEFPVCDPVDVSWHPHPFNCNRYFLCFWGILHERLCAPDLHYNRVTTQCMIPEQAGCEINLDVDCPPSDDEWVIIFIPDPTDCSRYHVCFKGQKISRTCHTNLWVQNAHVQYDLVLIFFG